MQFSQNELVEATVSCQPQLAKMVADVISRTVAIRVELRHALRMLLNLQLRELDEEYIVVIEGLFQYRGPKNVNDARLSLVYNIICTALVLRKSDNAKGAKAAAARKDDAAV